MSALLLKLDRLGPARFGVIFALVVSAALYLVFGLASAWRIEPPGLINADQPLGRDFIAFWSASALALDGAPEAVFDLKRIHDVQIAAVGARIDPTAWHYPPTYLLAVMPLATLPYLVSLVLWLTVPVAAFWLVLRRLYDSPATAWALLLFPGMTLCLVSGQNGIITAALLAAALLHLDTRPVLAGVLFGVLTYKPHLAALAFPALAVGGYWRTLGVAVATAAMFVLASIAVLGFAPWYAFFGNLDFLARVVDSGQIPWVRMPTVYVGLRQLGVDIGPARAAQGVATLTLLAAVCAVWYRGAPLAWRASMLALAIPLATPYAFDYDLVILVLPIAWLFRASLDEESLSPAGLAVAVAWAAPALFWLITLAGGPPLMPLILAWLMVLVWRRAFPAPS